MSDFLSLLSVWFFKLSSILRSILLWFLEESREKLPVQWILLSGSLQIPLSHLSSCHANLIETCFTNNFQSNPNIDVSSMCFYKFKIFARLQVNWQVSHEISAFFFKIILNNSWNREKQPAITGRAKKSKKQLASFKYGNVNEAFTQLEFTQIRALFEKYLDKLG